jgi:hypothetical protein
VLRRGGTTGAAHARIQSALGQVLPDKPREAIIRRVTGVRSV